MTTARKSPRGRDGSFAKTNSAHRAFRAPSTRTGRPTSSFANSLPANAFCWSRRCRPCCRTAHGNHHKPSAFRPSPRSSSCGTRPFSDSSRDPSRTHSRDGVSRRMTIRERPNLEFRMTRMLIAAITAVCMASSANAAMNRIEKGQQLKKLHKMYLQGVRDGLLAYNRQLETDTSRRGGGKPYFCLPRDFDLTIDKTEKLASRKMDNTASNLEDGSSNFDERYDVSFPRLLLAKLMEAYPCK